jgi:tetratricopeptide (TPR) repeat protein
MPRLSDQPPFHQPLSTDILDLLSQLVDQSLVLVERRDDARLTRPGAGGTGTRYRLLEIVRQYAAARLRAQDRELQEDAEEPLRRRHQQFYLELAETAGPHLWGPDQAAWQERLEVDLDNLRAALEWSLQSEPEPERVLRLADALGVFCIRRGYLEEARQRLAAALERAGAERHSRAGAWALAHLGYLAFLADDYPASQAYYEESLTAQRELGDPAAMANALCGLGYVARRRKEYAQARALHEESLAIRRALDDRPGMAQSLIGLGDTVREQGDGSPIAPDQYIEEALVIRCEIDDQAGIAEALGELANVAWRQGDYLRARQHRQESLAVWRELGVPLGVIHSLGALGHLARDQGEFEDARAFYTESLQLRWELGDRYTLVQALEDFAELAAREGEWTRMTRLFGAAEALRMGVGKPLRPRERSEYDRYLSGAQEVLGEAAMAAEQTAGRSMSLEEAVAFALASG